MMKENNLYEKITSNFCAFFVWGLLAACGQESTGSAETNENAEDMTEVAIGVNSEMNLEIWEDISERLEEKENITLNIVLFGSYVQNNRALHDGELGANAFQYFPTTYNYNKENNTILDEYQTEETKQFALDVSDGAYVPAWSEDDTALEDFKQFVEEQEAGE